MLQVASVLSGATTLGTLQPDPVSGELYEVKPATDGWLTLDPETGTKVYWNLCEVGTLYEPTGETIETEFGPVPAMAPLPGYHVNGLWNSTLPVPDALTAFRIYPTTPAIRFG